MENNDTTSAWCGACVTSRLPEACAIGIDNNAGALLVRRGRPGFSFYRSVISNDFNDAYSITAAQVSAMLLGAVTGWSSPFINAGLFDSSGLLFAQPREVSHCAYWCAARGLSGQISDDGRLPPKLSAASLDSIRENRQAFIASVRWRSFYCAEVRAAEQAFA